MPDAPQTVRIGELASAIGSTANAIRQWLTRYQDKGVRSSVTREDQWAGLKATVISALTPGGGLTPKTSSLE